MTTTAIKPATSTGRGYKALAIQRGETFSVAFENLRLKAGFNERLLFKGIPELAESIRSNGFSKLTPLIVEWNPADQCFDVIHGERRVRACRHLVESGIDPGPVWCMSESRNKAPLQQLIDQVLTNTGEQFNPLEKGRVYLRIQNDFPGTTGTEIAKRIGETKQAVSAALRLAKHGSDTLHAAITAERVSCTTALSIIESAGDDHAAQDKLLDRTLDAAAATGKSHATPKDLPATLKSQDSKHKTSAEWQIKELEPAWNENNVCTSPSRIIAGGFKWGIEAIAINYSSRTIDWKEKWFAGFRFQHKQGDNSHPVISDNGSCHDTPDDAILAAWADLHASVADYSERDAPKHKPRILAYLSDLGTALQAIYTASNASTSGAFIADLSDESGDSSSDSQPSADAPNDPGAIERIKASGSSATGLGGGSFGKGGDPKTETRIKKVHDLMEGLNKDNCHTDRWETIELILDYLDGDHTTAKIKTHLLGK